MLFNSYTFILFFLLVLFFYYCLKSWKWRKFSLLVASYLFYAAWNPPFVILLWISTIADWKIGEGIFNSEHSRSKNLLLICSLGINLGLLGFFKYGNFFLENFTAVLQVIGINFNPPQANIILPVGISFYTFQTLSYTIDIYLNKFKPWHSFLDYALYVTFFPQLVAGPIVRASDFLQQCKRPKDFLGEQFSWGVSLIILGLFEKIVVADGLLAPITESLYASEGIPSFSAAWVGTFAFSGQIFCDFAGYSTCAIGTALCLGFKLPINFRFPYAAIGFSDFWRRWHISLSTWLKDYLYIPLGGNRQGKIRTQINLMTTMLLGGLWHGAAWTFVVWGGLHGTYLIGERLLKEKFGNYKIWQTKVAQLGLGLLTFILICVTWVFFRADSFQQAGSIILAMVGLSTETVSITIGKQSIAICLGVISSILGIHWLMRDSTVEQLAIKTPWYWRSIALALMLYGIATLHGEDRSFIYFQF